MSTLTADPFKLPVALAVAVLTSAMAIGLASTSSPSDAPSPAVRAIPLNQALSAMPPTGSTAASGTAAPLTVGLPSATPPTVAADPAADLVSVTVGAPLPAVVPVGLVSLSMEAGLFNDGAVTVNDQSLDGLVTQLAPAQIRVGANTGDLQGLTSTGLASLASLAHDTGVPIVLALPLVRFDPIAAATMAAHAKAALGGLLKAVEIGNESDEYAVHGGRRPPTWSYATYRTQRAAYLTALSDAGVRVPLWGPDNASPTWLGLAAAESPRVFATLTPHYYPLSGCRGYRPTLGILLSGNVHRFEEEAADSFSAAARRSGLPVIVGETNSVSCGGTPGVSDRAGAAFWAADLAMLMARVGVQGLNIHIGLSGCTGYNPICLPAGGVGEVWRAAPTYLGLRLPALLRGGHFHAVRTVLTTTHNLRVYALAMPDHELRVVAFDLDPMTAAPVRFTISTEHGPVTTPETVVGGIQTPDYLGQTVLPIPAGAASELTLRPGQAIVWSTANPT